MAGIAPLDARSLPVKERSFNIAEPTSMSDQKRNLTI
jgi:hypothetical protein